MFEPDGSVRGRNEKRRKGAERKSSSKKIEAEHAKNTRKAAFCSAFSAPD
jgi:hypothetical protein